MKLSILLCVLLVAFTLSQSTDQKVEGPVIGIDLGTTFSVVGIWKDGKVEIIPNDQGNRITPSVVSFSPSGGHLVGEAAKNNLPSNPKNTIYDVKRLIGRKFTEVLKEDKDLFSYELANVDGKAYVKVDVNGESKTYSPEQISAMILSKMKKTAEDFLGEPVKHAVITCPAYFNDAQREATRNAGTIAGLNVLRVIAEPTAASLAYGLDLKTEQEIIVFDLGGGTFDVSLLTLDNGVFQVRATSGDMHLGGEDFDLRLTEHLAKEFVKKHGADADVMKDKKAFQKLKMAAEKAKRILSNELETTIEIEALIKGLDFSAKVSRTLFEELNKDLFAKTLNPVKQVLADTKLSKKDIDVVVMVGGSTRIPKVKELVSQFFDGKQLQTDVNPDEAIGYGAAVQGAIIKGVRELQGTTILNVCPLSLGIETVGGVMAKIINRNTGIPTSKYDTFTTTEDYQTQLVIPIYEGERAQTKYNRLLGELTLSDIPPAKKGYPQIKVTFSLDKNGILQVSAEDTATKNKKDITIQKGALTPEEIRKMTEDAVNNAGEDEEFKRGSEARQRLETYIETTKNNLANKNIANRIKSQDKKKITRALSRAQEFIRNNDQADKKEIYDQLVSLKRTVQPILAKLTGETVEDFPEEPVKEEKKEEKKEDKNTINIEEEKKKDEL